MEDSKGSQGVDFLNYSTMASQCDDSVYSHNVEKQADLNNGALDIVTHDEKALQDPNMVDWDGPNDLENPLNWASSKKLVVIAIVLIVTVLS